MVLFVVCLFIFQLFVSLCPHSGFGGDLTCGLIQPSSFAKDVTFIRMQCTFIMQDPGQVLLNLMMQPRAHTVGIL